jgi:diadenosine tetraphosphate (Ap4A) HIT family hydrolase
MARIGRKIAAALRRSSLRPDGVNLYLADGPAAGQTVFHAHLHVLPRHVGDGSGFRFLGGAAREYTRQELDAHAAELRQGIN